MKIGDYETHPAADLMPLIEGNEFRKLCKSIIERGLERPIELFEGKVLDGRNRLRACIEVSRPPQFVTVDVADPYEYVWAHNAVRRHLEAGQRAAIRLKFDEALRAHMEERRRESNRRRSESAKARERAANGTLSGQSVTTLSPTGSEESKKTRRELASRADVGVVTAQKAITLRDEAPELLEEVVDGKKSLSAAFRQHKRDVAIGQVRSEPAPMPDGPFRVIVADPPWAYDKRNDDGSHRGAIPYHSMSISQICAMPVAGDLAHEDSILWLWTTNAHMRHAFHVVDAWGFAEKTILTWDKGRMGAGDWLRGQTEHCILAVRGRPQVSLTNQTTLLRAARGKHSEKPDEFYELVDELCPGSKLELFARKPREGWAVWGSEV